jgi:NADPH:quinone reductase-like Zn-dependent oxidoreductase
MKAVSIVEHGGPEVLRYAEDLPRPAVGPGEVLVRQHSAGLNYLDTLLRRGYPGLALPLPHSPGGDIAGEVAELGDSVTGWRTGDRVVVYPIINCGACQLCREGRPNLCLNWRFIGMHTPGGYQEYVAVPAANLIRLPESVSYRDAAALPVAGLTAYHGIMTVGQLQPGQTFFIWGGAGGLGNIAVQLAKAQGARVIATAGTEEKLELLRGLGADLVINRHTQDAAALVREFAPNGVDLIIDYVGPQTFPTSFELLKKGGKLLLCGIITGREAMVSLHMTYLRHLSILGLYMGLKEELAALVELLAEGRVKPVIQQTLPLSEAAEGHRRLEAGAVVGKLVFEI